MTPDEARILVHAVMRIFRHWDIDLATTCRILGVEFDEYQSWRDGSFELVPDSVLDRMSVVLTMHTCLRAIYRDPTRGYDWMHRPNRTFENRSPIQLIASGQVTDLLRLARYLHAEIQAW